MSQNSVFMNRRKVLPSVSDFAEMLNKTVKKNAKLPVYSGQFLVSTASSVSSLMSSSKGRDKICSFIQYCAHFYFTCVENSNIPEVQLQYKNGEFKSARLCLKIKESMSQGRKIFRFLKFLDELKTIQNFLKTTNKPLILKVLITLRHVSSFFYYILDNTLWGVKTGVLSEYVDHDTYKVWKYKKNWFSLFRNILQLTINLLKWDMSNTKHRMYTSELQSMRNKIVQTDDESYDVIRLLIRRRRKRRYQMLEVIHSVLRLVMLSKSLKLPGYSHLEPVFVAFCGLTSSVMSLFKAFTEKQKLLKIEENNNQLPELKRFSSSNLLKPTRSFSNPGNNDDIIE